MSNKLKENHWPAIVFVFAVISAAFTGLGLLWFGIRDPEIFISLGQWGDFFGGTLNPIFTFVTLLGLLLTIALQRKELTLTRKELERSANALESQSDQINAQKFENTFFQMLSMFNEIVDSIEVDHTNVKKTYKCRDAINYICNLMNRSYSEYITTQFNASEKRPYTPTEMIDSFSTFFIKKYSDKTSHYFRLLYNIFKFIDNSEHAKLHHSRMVRSLLSNQELKLLFYNSLSEPGRKFKAAAEKHALFDNLPTNELLEPNHKLYFSEKAFGIENAAE
ncbi:putative phage abortive infection protein [Thalassospira povalilytica]|uniref:putative phage abortive infection protein n=1 Tax=Thalassospira povalilytica TaxID=732237 RepID=UPI003AA9CF56